MFSTDDLGLILIVLAFAALLVRSIIDAIVNKDALKSYRDLVTGITSNAGLSDAVEKRYLTLTPEQKKYADQAFDLIDLLARLTPTDADDKLSQWAKEVRDGKLINPPTIPG